VLIDRHGSLCSAWVQRTPAVNAERQRRNLGDRSVAHRQCVEQGFQPGTPLYLQCRQIAANREAAQEAVQKAAYANMLAVGLR
jgi:hypothetical protein